MENTNQESSEGASEPQETLGANMAQSSNDGDQFRAWQSKHDALTAENEKLEAKLKARMDGDEQEKYELQNEAQQARRLAEEAQIKLEEERNKATQAAMSETRNRLIKNDFPELEPWKDSFNGDNEGVIKEQMESARKELRGWAAKYGKDFIEKGGVTESNKSAMPEGGSLDVENFKRIPLKEKKKMLRSMGHLEQSRQGNLVKVERVVAH